ncbi:MAG TPA: hypothetical protein VGQ57_10725 [Polyangiaceae bacterium]|nr:hypothetical protein [Polyangiaceae bacterium]
MNRSGRLRRTLGSDALPSKLGSVAAARIEHGRERGCDRCFPHGPETTNSSLSKNERSWKRSRKTAHRR